MATRTTSAMTWRFLNPRLQVRHVRQAQEYYRDMFGLEVRWAWGDDIGGVGVDDLEMYLVRRGLPTPSEIAVFVEDADAVYERCREAGAKIVRPIVTERWGLRGFTVEDADGNRVGIAHEVHGPDGRPEYESF
jgi:predicted enzyme related to lactoylglutathione lyase